MRKKWCRPYEMRKWRKSIDLYNKPFTYAIKIVVQKASRFPFDRHYHPSLIFSSKPTTLICENQTRVEAKENNRPASLLLYDFNYAHKKFKCTRYRISSIYCCLIIHYSANRRAPIRLQCKKTTVLNCHRCLINTGVEKMNSI